MEGQMDVWKINPCVLQDIDPLDPLCAAQKGKTFMTLHTSSILMKVHPFCAQAGIQAVKITGRALESHRLVRGAVRKVVMTEDPF